MKKVIYGGMMLCIVMQTFAAYGKPPLEFFKSPHFPKTTDGGTITFKYTLLNNTPVTLPLTISTPTVSSGSVSLSSGTCGATLASSAKCDLTYTFTAPTNSSSTPLDITGSFQIAYNGRYPLKDTTLRFIVPKDAPEFTEQPDFSPAITVPSSGTHTLRYAVKNNLSTTITSVSFSPTVSSGTIAANGGTCGSSIAGGTTCTKTFLFTAPANSRSTETSVTGTMTFNYTDSTGAQTLSGDALAFSITPAPKPSITILEHSLMFPNRDFGNSSSYTGKITISNNGTADISSITRATDNVTFVSTTCNFPLTSGNSCTQTYSSAIPITTDSTVQLTPNSSVESGNTITIPVSGIGILPLAPPTDTAVGLTLVNGCADTINDGGLIMITNNTNQTLANISISASDGLSATITNPTFSEDSNVYCKGNQLAPNGYCEFRVASSAAASTTGEIIIHGSLVSGGTITHAHHYNLQTKVVAQASPFPYTTGTNSNGDTNTIANNTCNLVQVFTTESAVSNWNDANTFCSTTIHGFSNWRLSDIGPTPPADEISPVPQSTGELYPITQFFPYTTLLLNVWSSPINNSRTWILTNGTNLPNHEFLLFPGTKNHLLSYNANSCSRAFTTNSDGS